MKKIFTSIVILIIMALAIYHVSCAVEEVSSEGVLPTSSIILDNEKVRVTLPIEELSYNPKAENLEDKYKTGEVLLNPGKGFVLKDAKQNILPESKSPIAVSYDTVYNIGYNRFYWYEIEPNEGEYNWAKIDSQIEAFAARGKKFAFGVSCASSSVNRAYVTPEWVFNAGAEYYEAEITSTLTQIIPVWTDKIFLEKLNNFVKALGERYDGNENIAYIDIRSFGNFGEQHLQVIGGEYITNDQLIELYLQPYREAFPNTLLVNPFAISKYQDANEWAVDNGITLRKDAIMAWSNGSDCYELVKNKNGRFPLIWEFGYKYSYMKNTLQSWDEDKLLKQMEAGKPSYVEFDTLMYDEETGNPRFCEYVANKMGYYFQFIQAEYTDNIKTTENNDISLTFLNKGVARLCEPCTVYIGLLDENNNLVKKYKTDIDPHEWMPEEEKTENISLQLNDVDEGEYTFALGLFYNEDDEKPTYLLGNTQKTYDNWYTFGNININYPEEEYIIKDENSEKAIKESEEYKVSIDIKNLRKNDKYSIKLYVNENQKQVVDVDSNEKNYSDEIKFRLDEEKNNYKIQIEKNDKVVAELTNDIYVTDYVQNYIANNPVEIEYSTTEITNKPITATLKTNAEITITNNQNNKTYTFEENGDFTFEYTIKGQKFTKTATVNNIDKNQPTITGVEEGKTYTEKVTPNVTDKNLEEVKLYKDSNQVQNYELNSSISEAGDYKIVATDKAGNQTIVNFVINTKISTSEETKNNTQSTDNTKIINNMQSSDTQNINKANAGQMATSETQPTKLPNTGTKKVALIVIVILFVVNITIAFLIRYGLIKMK